MLNLVVLGLVQGLTEYLPVSSTAHLLFAEHFLGVRRPGLVLEAVLHLGTAAAAVALFRADLVRLARGAVAWVAGRRADPYARPAAAVVVATAVTAALGLAFASPLERLFASVRGTAAQLIVTGVILLWQRERGQRGLTDATPLDGVALGVAQAAAIVPGISRSGITIVAGLALGLRRAEAARLSFLMAVPAIVGASLFSLRDLDRVADAGINVADLAAGFGVAAAVGAGAIVWVMQFVRQGRLAWFGVYCWIVGLAVLATVR
ncbi:MAG: undecaprenyl-diphosphate phosphatase [Armatimonadota bacterium]|nr:undecaprenyl-diphosphate phosphatase [Armatimonadota bacterium]MDR7532350.1 undecaprenyl-diphosphate phosphatase [Armatimonadota bacterium]MDR7535277.1 undecaprenyl-diphosphate phosphatase [Armatimonadota bacterium]